MEIHLTFKINGSNESKTIWSKVKHDAILGNKKTKIYRIKWERSQNTGCSQQSDNL